MVELHCSDDERWRCRKHLLVTPHDGICPACLRDRLLVLRRDCASPRPCGCSTSSPSSSSSSAATAASSSASFLLRSLSLGAPSGSGGGIAIGAVGLVSDLIGREPAFRKSRSAAFRAIRPGSDGRGRSKGWPSWLWRLYGQRREGEGAMADEVGTAGSLYRSRSVGALVSAEGMQSNGGGGGAEGNGKGWGSLFLSSPIKAFRQRARPSRAAVHKKTAAVHKKSPLCRE